MGLAVGDALGTTLEFRPPGTFTPVTGITGGGPFSLEPGEWTDDTSLALCLAESLIESKGFSKRDQLERYVRWMEEGHLSSNGLCFDIGYTTRYSLMRFKRTGLVNTDRDEITASGNGSIMRLAPVPMYYVSDPLNAVIQSGESSKTTHAAYPCIDACRYFGGLIFGALNGVSKDMLLSSQYSPLETYWGENMLCKEIAEVACGSFKQKKPPDIKGTGYVVKSLEAALWSFHNTTNFRDGCLKAVNLGDDADTTGAVYGQLAGAYYGYENIPKEWTQKIAKKELIIDYVEKIYKLAKQFAEKL